MIRVLVLFIRVGFFILVGFLFSLVLVWLSFSLSFTLSLAARYGGGGGGSRLDLHGEYGVVHRHLVVVHVHVDVDRHSPVAASDLGCTACHFVNRIAIHLTLASHLHLATLHAEVRVGHAHAVVVHVHVDGAASLVWAPAPGH